MLKSVNTITHKLLLLLLLFWTGMDNGLGAQTAIHLSHNAEHFQFMSGYQTFYDTSGLLDIEQIAKLPPSRFDFDLKTYTPQKHEYLWLRLQLKVDAGLEKIWMFEVFNQRAAEIIVFAKDDTAKYHAIDTIGTEHPFYQRNLHSRYPAFQIPLREGENILLIKYKPKHFLTFNTLLKPTTPFINDYNAYYFIIGGFYLVLLILMLYNFLFFISTLDKIYLYYILFVMASALDCLRVDHLGFALLWPNVPAINDYIDELVRPLFIFGLINYASYFLVLKKDFPRLHTTIWAVFSIYILQQALYVFLVPIFYYSHWISEILIFTMLFSILYLAIIRLKQKQKATRVFIIGYISMVCGIVITYFLYNGWIEGNDFFYYILFYSISIDTFMFSFALSSRLRHERQEKERALKAESDARQKVIEQMQQNEDLLNKVNAELEDKVRERTLEIEASRQKLAEQAQLIQQWNINLDQENWNLNKTIKSLKIRKVIPENQTYAQIQELFRTETECYTFLSDYKWRDGFLCRKCGNTKEAKTNDFYLRRCSKCGTIESITAHTIFHKLKFPLDKAFYIAYSVFTHKDLNVSDLSREIDLNYKTCLKFKMRIEEAIEARKKKGIKVKSWEDVILES